MRLSILTLTCLCIAFSANSADTPVKDLLKKELWGKIYKDGGQCFYTKKPFSKRSPLLSESYIYSSSWIRDYLKCGTDRQCKRQNPEYVRMISDLHNIVVAQSNLAFKLRSSTFGILDDSIEADEYGMRARFHIVEPASDIKGDIARVMYYMHKTYDLPIRGNLPDFVLWNESDPPSAEERARNDLIESIQGSRNPYVDDPSQIKRP